MASFGASDGRELLVHMKGGKEESSYANNSLLQVLSFLFILICFLFFYIHLTFIFNLIIAEKPNA